MTKSGLAWTLRVKYSPDQPRVPAGRSGGGRWTFERSGAEVGREYFESGSGAAMIASLKGAERRAFVDIVGSGRVLEGHMEGLNVVTTFPHGRYPDWVVEGRGKYAGEITDGVYDPDLGSIHLNPDGGVYNLAVVLHELGHHVTLGSPWRKTEGAETLEAMAGAFDSPPDGYRKAGLTDYSFRGPDEFMADCYVTYVAGPPDVRRNLARLLGVGDLDEIFGRGA